MVTCFFFSCVNLWVHRLIREYVSAGWRPCHSNASMRFWQTPLSSRSYGKNCNLLLNSEMDLKESRMTAIWRCALLFRSRFRRICTHSQSAYSCAFMLLTKISLSEWKTQLSEVYLVHKRMHVHYKHDGEAAQRDFSTNTLTLQFTVCVIASARWANKFYFMHDLFILN